jgi:hypothetical protein
MRILSLVSVFLILALFATGKKPTAATSVTDSEIHAALRNMPFEGPLV